MGSVLCAWRSSNNIDLMVFGLTEVNPRYFALETSMLTKHNMKRVSIYFHSWLDNTYNKKVVASVKGFSVFWGIWNIQIRILYLSAPTYLYHLLIIGANVRWISIDWVFVAQRQFSDFPAISWREQVKCSMRWWWCPLCTRPTRWVGIL
jgi:hypothetical protein